MPAGQIRTTVYNRGGVKVEYESSLETWRPIANGPELTAAVMSIVAGALPYAKSISPRSRRQHRTDGNNNMIPRVHYADAFVTRKGSFTPLSNGLRRVAGELHNLSPHSTLVEWGSVHNAAQHILRKTLEHIEATHGGPG